MRQKQKQSITECSSELFSLTEISDGTLISLTNLSTLAWCLPWCGMFPQFTKPQTEKTKSFVFLSKGEISTIVVCLQSQA